MRNPNLLTKDPTPLTNFEKPSQQQSSNSISNPTKNNSKAKLRASSHYAISQTPFSRHSNEDENPQKQLGVVAGCPSMPSKM